MKDFKLKSATWKHYDKKDDMFSFGMYADAKGKFNYISTPVIWEKEDTFIELKEFLFKIITSNFFEKYPEAKLNLEVNNIIGPEFDTLYMLITYLLIHA